LPWIKDFPRVANNAAENNISTARFAFDWIVGLLIDFIGEFLGPLALSQSIRDFFRAARAQLGSRPTSSICGFDSAACGVGNRIAIGLRRSFTAADMVP
jgi:hypothetical protein